MTHIIIHDRNFIRRARRRVPIDEKINAAFCTVLDRFAALPRRTVMHALVLTVAAIVALTTALR